MRRPRPLTLLAGVLMLLAACGQDPDLDRGGRVEGDTVTVYSSLPLRGEAGASSRDIVDGEKLALARAGGRAGPLAVTFVSLDDSDPAAGGPTPASVAAAARRAITDPAIIAYLGEPDTEAALVSAPLMNAAGILHVSPGATYVGLTRPGRGARPGEPERLYPAGAGSFARVVPADDDQARSVVAALRARGVRRLVVLPGEGVAARALGHLVRDAAGVAGLRVVPPVARAEAAFHPGAPAGAAARALGAESARDSGRLLVAADALGRTDLARRLPEPVRRRALVATAVPAASPALAAFAGEFRRRFGRAPGPYAVVGFETMAVVLDAVGRAGEGGRERQRVVDALRATRGRSGLLGRYSIAPGGDATLRRYRLARLSRGAPAAP